MIQDKKKLISVLKNKYGDAFCPPLARDLEVNVTTVRRIFQRDKIPKVYCLAISKILENYK